MAEFAPLDGVEGGAAFDGFDERLHVAEESGRIFALGAGDGSIENAEPEGFESGDFAQFLGDEFVGEDVSAFAEKVIAEQEERLRGHHGLVSLTGHAGGIDEIKEGAQAVRASAGTTENGQIDGALELLG